MLNLMPPVSEPAMRAATPADAPLIEALAGRIWRAAYREMLSKEQIEYMLRWMYAPHKLVAEMAAGVRYEIASASGEPCGYLALEFIAAESAVWLHKLYLLPEVHGRGWGQAMLHRAAAHGRELGAAEIALRVNKENRRALRAYERFGFVRTDAVCADIGGGFVMDDFILRRSLAEGDAAQGAA
jgi:diamine N-acetyltransferase